MEIVFLGTGSMVPTVDRNATGILISYKNENILVDCGEGTQKQFRYANISPAKVTRILITHWHGDHIFGLPGLLTSIAKFAPRKRIEIYGPVGSKRYFDTLQSSYIPLDANHVEVHEIKENTVFFENEDFTLKAFGVEHTARCLGYLFIEKNKRNINVDYIHKFGLKQHPILKELANGKDIVWNSKKILAKNATTVRSGKVVCIVLDSRACKSIVANARNADLFICEATLGDEFEEKADDYKHLTASKAAMLAKEANVRKLIITHFSQRYKDITPLLKEARKVFKETTAAKDLMRVLV